jgi:hypothetical protein
MDDSIPKVLFHSPQQPTVPLTHTGDRSDVLYIRLMKGMTIEALLKIVNCLRDVADIQVNSTTLSL